MCVIRHGGKTTTKPGSETDRTPWRSYGTSPSDSSASTANTRSKKRPKRSAETGTEPSTYYSPKVTIMTDGNHDAALGVALPGMIRAHAGAERSLRNATGLQRTNNSNAGHL